MPCLGAGEATHVVVYLCIFRKTTMCSANDDLGNRPDNDAYSFIPNSIATESKMYSFYDPVLEPESPTP